MARYYRSPSAIIISRPSCREAQRHLLERVFSDQPWEAWLLSLREQVVRGQLDDKLVYRKRLRRDVKDYASAPPHVKAARMVTDPDEDDAPAAEVEYLMTTSRGAEPLSMRSAPIDYDHYLDKQLAPAVDVVLGLLGTSFERIAGAQLSLFD